MPSFPVRAAFFALRTARLLHRSSGKPLEENVRLARAKPRVEPSAKMRAGLDVRCEQLPNGQIWHVAAREPNRERTASIRAKRVVFFHGGGYMFPVQQVHWWFVAHMVRVHRIPFSVALYPLAPEHTAQQFTEFAAEVIEQLSATDGAENLIVMGDSAGGGLAVLATLELQRRQQPLPGGLVLLCPWLDLNPSQPDQRKVQSRDIMLSVAGIERTGNLVAGDLAVTDPRVSPIYADFSTDFPPILLFGGGDDTLVTDARRLKAKVPTVEYFEAPGQMHVWPLMFFAEARRAQIKMAEFISRC
jgi:epsilon-lactone hydrolase